MQVGPIKDNGGPGHYVTMYFFHQYSQILSTFTMHPVVFPVRRTCPWVTIQSGSPTPWLPRWSRNHSLAYLQHWQYQYRRKYLNYKNQPKCSGFGTNNNTSFGIGVSLLLIAFVYCSTLTNVWSWNHSLAFLQPQQYPYRREYLNCDYQPEYSGFSTNSNASFGIGVSLLLLLCFSTLQYLNKCV